MEKALVGFYYDGSFFDKVSRYYRFFNGRREFLNLGGLQELICAQLNSSGPSSTALYELAEAHFFKGRFSTRSLRDFARAGQNIRSISTTDELGIPVGNTISEDERYIRVLESDRYVEDNLMYANIEPHYYRVSDGNGSHNEKGIDVWLALSAFEAVMERGVDVVVVFTGDEDFVPLFRKLKAKKKTVVLVSEKAEWEDRNGEKRFLGYSRRLAEEADFVFTLGRMISELEAVDGSSCQELFIAN